MGNNVTLKIIALVLFYINKYILQYTNKNIWAVHINARVHFPSTSNIIPKEGEYVTREKFKVQP